MLSAIQSIRTSVEEVTGEILTPTFLVRDYLPEIEPTQSTSSVVTFSIRQDFYFVFANSKGEYWDASASRLHVMEKSS
jgi:hypothetical protein